MTDKKCPWCKKDIRVLFTLDDGLIVAKVEKLYTLKELEEGITDGVDYEQ